MLAFLFPGDWLWHRQFKAAWSFKLIRPFVSKRIATGPRAQPIRVQVRQELLSVLNKSAIRAHPTPKTGEQKYYTAVYTQMPTNCPESVRSWLAPTAQIAV